MTKLHPLRRLALALVTAALLLPVSAVVGPSAAGASPTYQAPGTIDATGSQDVTAALVAFIRSVPDGSTITFPRGARYHTESTIAVGFRHDLVIDGAGAEFFATTDGSGATPIGPSDVQWKWPRHRDQWVVYNSINVTLRNLTVRGPNPNAGLGDAAYVEALEGQAAVEFFGTVNSRLENCSLSDTYGDFVYIGKDATGTVVRGCTMARSGRQGITVSDAQNVLIDHNNISYVRRTAIDLEPWTPEWAIQNVWIVNNTFGPTRLCILGAKGEGDVNNVVFANNRMTGVPIRIKNTPLNGRRHDWFVIGNSSDRVYGSAHGAIWINRTDHVVVTGNYQALQSKRNPSQIATEFVGSTGVTLSGNQFPYVPYK